MGDKPAEVSGEVEFWHFFADRESDVIAGVVKKFEDDHPDITVKVVDAQDDEKLRQAISSGKGPDVGLSYSTDVVGSFCSSGAFRDLGPYVERDEVDLDQFPETVISYTQYEGQQCSMPVLADAYGLYYNTAMFAEAGITEPPKTISELDALAKQLTIRSADGTIERAGFLPLMGWYENSPSHLGPHFGATWLKDDGTSNIGSDPQWVEMLEWNKSLVEWFGYEKLVEFRTSLGEEYSPDNAFHQGKVAMNVDGEYRNAFIAADAPDLEYATAPFPMADDLVDRYGSGYVTGNIIGIGKGSDNPEAAWELIKYLTTDTDAIVELSNGLKNLPTTHEAMESPDLEVDANFQTFIDMFNHPDTTTTPASKSGAGYQQTFSTWIEAWQQGGVDLDAGLAEVDKQIDDQLALVAGP